MLISEVIEKLLAIQKEHGNIQCTVQVCHFEQSSDRVQSVNVGTGGWSNDKAAVISADYD